MNIKKVVAATLILSSMTAVSASAAEFNDIKGLYQKIVKRNISLYLTLVLYSVMSEVRRIQKRRKKQQNQKSLSRKVFEVLTYILQ